MLSEGEDSMLKVLEFQLDQKSLRKLILRSLGSRMHAGQRRQYGISVAATADSFGGTRFGNWDWSITRYVDQGLIGSAHKADLEEQTPPALCVSQFCFKSSPSHLQTQVAIVHFMTVWPSFHGAMAGVIATENWHINAPMAKYMSTADTTLLQAAELHQPTICGARKLMSFESFDLSLFTSWVCCLHQVTLSCRLPDF